MRMSDWSSDVCSSDLDTTPSALLREELSTMHRPCSRSSIASVRDGFTKARGSSSCTRSSLSRLRARPPARSEDHTSELQSIMRISHAVLCLKKKNLVHKDHVCISAAIIYSQNTQT